MAEGNQEKLLERIADSLQDIKFYLRGVLEQGNRMEELLAQQGGPEEEEEDREEPNPYQTL